MAEISSSKSTQKCTPHSAAFMNILILPCRDQGGDLVMAPPKSMNEVPPSLWYPASAAAVSWIPWQGSDGSEAKARARRKEVPITSHHERVRIIQYTLLSPRWTVSDRLTCNNRLTTVPSSKHAGTETLPMWLLKQQECGRAEPLRDRQLLFVGAFFFPSSFLVERTCGVVSSTVLKLGQLQGALRMYTYPPAPPAYHVRSREALLFMSMCFHNDSVHVRSNSPVRWV